MPRPSASYAGNTVGLHRLLIQYRATYQLAREALLRRIEHEAARAVRSQDAADEQAKVRGGDAGKGEWRKGKLGGE